MIRRVITLLSLTSSTLIITILAILLLSAETLGASLCVNTTGAGGCYTKIQDAIDNASPGDVIQVSAGTFTEHIIMTDGVSIYGEGWENTIIDGGYTTAQSTVLIEPGVSASTILSGVHIIGGGTGEITSSINSNVFGGGISIWYASPKIINTWVSDNTAKDGGGVYVNSGAPTFDNVPVWSNKAERGGGYYMKSNVVTMTGVMTTNPLDTNATIWWNTATIEGGGMYLENTSGTINGVRVWWNEADKQGSTVGGGIHIYGDSPVDIHHNWIGGNSARRGGGLSTYDADNLKITDNLVLENSASYGGGGFVFSHSSGLLKNNQVLSNTTDTGSGGGVYIFGNVGVMNINENLFQGNGTNPLQGNGETAIAVDGSGMARINANTFVKNRGFSASGIRLNQSGAVTITNNIFAQNQANFGAAVYIEESSPVRLVNNTITENDGAGVYFDDADNIVIVNNIIYNNADNGLSKNPTDTSSYTIDYNNVYDNKGSGPDYAGGLTAGAHDTAVNPLFVAVGNDPTVYYHLQPSSPVNATGSTLWAPEQDIDGQIRLSDGAVSMGADEYVSAAVAVSVHADQQSVQPGDSFNYTFYVTNTGDIDVSAIMTDIMPSQVSPNNQWVWTAAIPVPNGVWTKSLNVTVDENYTGVLTNVFRVSTAEGASAIYTHTLSVVDENLVYLPMVLRK